MGILSEERVNGYFAELVKKLPNDRSVKAIVVAHAVPNTVLFLPFLNKIVDVACVLAKPKSTGNPEYKAIQKMFYTYPLTREWASSSGDILTLMNRLNSGSTRFVLVDIGGYFAESASGVEMIIGDRFLGVLEGTENGLQKYERGPRPTFPLITVARSPLKLPEDYLVASSVVFSIEAVLRDESEILQTRSAVVIGYGKVGSAVADILRGRGINTVVYDKSPIQLAMAAAKGFQAHTTLKGSLSGATLVVCATGNRSLSKDDFFYLRDGAVIASVTSADDELDFTILNQQYTRKNLSKHLTRYERADGSGHHIMFVSDGNAANFVHGAVIGPAIQLIEGEKLAAVAQLIRGAKLPAALHSGPPYYELPPTPRTNVAQIWNSHFLVD